MPAETEIRLADGDHVVQFYGTDEDLVGSVVSYLGGAIANDDTAIVIATPAHRSAFEAALREAGLDVDAARERSRLVVLDAADTLARIMTGDTPDADAFDAVVGDLVRAGSAGGRRVRAYGEMVALLWDEGNVNGAIELERLWNGLGERMSFSIFCAYPAHMFSDPQAAEDFSQVCHLHSEVVAGAPGPGPAEVSRRFAATRHGPRLARRFVSEALHDWGLSPIVDDAALVTTELATNAVVHARSDFTVALSRVAGGVRIEVGDSSSVAPGFRDPASTEVGGHGLRLVDAIARRWDHSVVAGGKRVWVELGSTAEPDSTPRQLT